jgi:hypothetical protein
MARKSPCNAAVYARRGFGDVGKLSKNESYYRIIAQKHMGQNPDLRPERELFYDK